MTPRRKCVRCNGRGEWYNSDGHKGVGIYPCDCNNCVAYELSWVNFTWAPLERTLSQKWNRLVGHRMPSNPPPVLIINGEEKTIEFEYVETDYELKTYRFLMDRHFQEMYPEISDIKVVIWD